jgi:Cation transporter/ATPase, N-terminus
MPERAPGRASAAPEGAARSEALLADAHQHDSHHLARHLGVQVDEGLAADEVRQRQQRHGPNRLPEPPPRPLWQRLLDPFRDFMVLVLLAAALVNEAPEAGAPADDGSLYTVVIGKTNNAKVHQIVAELLGISPADAAKMCQKPIVSLAKEVPHSEALAIKQRFANSNIQVRLSKKR